jgi:hypothetical protein
MKTSELSGAALDWAVAKCESPEWGEEGWQVNCTHRDDDGWIYQPSTDWAQGGPIIERECITVCMGSPTKGYEWMACLPSGGGIQHAQTYLIAAMRCYVASKLGDEIELPKELT